MTCRFHLAFPVDDASRARSFSRARVLGCPEGRSADHWVDFDLFGHQIVAHLAPEAKRQRATNPVDGEDVPVPHFGVVLRYRGVAGACRAAGRRATEFMIAPTVRFAGPAGEQATMFLLDPAGNALEFKAMADPSKLFAKD